MLIILFFLLYYFYNSYVMSPINKKKIVYSLWSLVYLALAVVIVVSSVSLFNNFYYESVYVHGASMSPTLSGNGVEDSSNFERLGSDYGIIDKSNGAKRNVKRYQIVTTFYPGENPDTASYKIKRVLAKPGERFKIENYNLYLYNEKDNSWGEPLDMPFDRNLENDHHMNYPATTLSKDQYFLAGDNWSHSQDSFDVGPIDFDLLVGVVVKMQGRCTVKDNKVIEKEEYKARYFLGVDY